MGISSFVGWLTGGISQLVGKRSGVGQGAGTSYVLNLESWQKIRVFIRGMVAVRQCGTRYVPPAPGQSALSYALFLRRGYMPPATWSTATFYTGLVMSRPPIMETPGYMSEPLKKITVEDESIRTAIHKAVTSVMQMGNYGVMLTWSEESLYPRIAFFDVEAVKDMVVVGDGDRKRLVQVLLSDTETVIDEKTGDYVSREIERVLILRKEDSGWKYYTKVVAQGQPDAEPVLMRFNGRTIDFIPFMLVTFDGDRYKYSTSPVESVAEAQCAYLQTACAHRNAQYKVGVPLPVFAGFKKPTRKQPIGVDELVAAALSSEDAAFFQSMGTAVEDESASLPFTIGADSALWEEGNENAKAYYMEVAANGLEHLRDERKDLLEEMARFGSRALQPAANGTTATEVRERGLGHLSVLGFASQMIAERFTELLQWIAIIGFGKQRGSKELEAIVVQLTTRFITDVLDSSLLDKLMVAVADGLVSPETLYVFLSKHGVTRDGVDFEMEQSSIQAQGPSPDRSKEVGSGQLTRMLRESDEKEKG